MSVPDEADEDGREHGEDVRLEERDEDFQDPDAQGQGIGRGIMDALEALVTRRQLGTRLDLVAAPDVVPFYRRLGYSQLPGDLMRKPLWPSRASCPV